MMVFDGSQARDTATVAMLLEETCADLINVFGGMNGEEKMKDFGGKLVV